MLDKRERAVKNEHSRYAGSDGRKTQNEDKHII
jgi:hypothetical protein